MPVKQDWVHPDDRNIEEIYLFTEGRDSLIHGAARSQFFVLVFGTWKVMI